MSAASPGHGRPGGDGDVGDADSAGMPCPARDSVCTGDFRCPDTAAPHTRASSRRKTHCLASATLGPRFPCPCRLRRCCVAGVCFPAVGCSAVRGRCLGHAHRRFPENGDVGCRRVDCCGRHPSLWELLSYGVHGLDPGCPETSLVGNCVDRDDQMFAGRKKP